MTALSIHLLSPNWLILIILPPKGSLARIRSMTIPHGGKASYNHGLVQPYKGPFRQHWTKLTFFQERKDEISRALQSSTLQLALSQSSIYSSGNQKTACKVFSQPVALGTTESTLSWLQKWRRDPEHPQVWLKQEIGAIVTGI